METDEEANQKDGDEEDATAAAAPVATPAVALVTAYIFFVLTL